MEVLVTGATGFVGGALVDRLLKQRWQVTAFVRRGSKIVSLKRKNVKLVFGDITDSTSVKKAVKGIDVVFNSAAALPHHKLADSSYWKVNVDGVKNVMEAAKTWGVKRVVHISTVGIFGATSRRGVGEKARPKLSDIYSITKLEGEKIAWKYVREGLPVVIIRPTIAYGPGDTRPGFLDLFVLIKKGMFISIGKGNNFFHTIYLENLVDALMLAAVRKSAVGQDFIIGDEPCPTMGQIVETIAKVQGKKLPGFYLPKRLALMTGLVFDLAQKFGLPAPLNSRRVKFITEEKKFRIEKAKRVLGYRAKISLDDGIEKTYDWYRKNGYL